MLKRRVSLFNLSVPFFEFFLLVETNLVSATKIAKGGKLYDYSVTPEGKYKVTGEGVSNEFNRAEFDNFVGDGKFVSDDSLSTTSPSPLNKPSGSGAVGTRTFANAPVSSTFLESVGLKEATITQKGTNFLVSGKDALGNPIVD